MTHLIDKSIESVLALTVSVVGADAYAYYEFGYAPSDRAILFADGSRISLPARLDLSTSNFIPVLVGDALVVLRDLKIEDGRATLAFRFSDPQLFSRMGTLAGLNQGHRVIEALVCRKEDVRTQSRLADKALALEWQLVEEKVASRAAGLLTSPEPGTALHDLENHVQTVFRSRALKPVLAERVHELEARLAEQSVVSQAKVLIRSSIGVSEAQAYARLRLLSRRSRRRIGEIAEDLLASQDVLAEVGDVRGRAPG